jgi:hypothetical protein
MMTVPTKTISGRKQQPFQPPKPRSDVPGYGSAKAGFKKLLWRHDAQRPRYPRYLATALGLYGKHHRDTRRFMQVEASNAYHKEAGCRSRGR